MAPRASSHPLAAARAALAARGVPGWLVGGAVRDALLGRASADVDIVVPGGAVELGRAIARAHGGAFVPLSPERGIVRVVWPGGAAAAAAAHAPGGSAGEANAQAGSGPGDAAGEATGDAVLDLTEFVGGSLASDLAARDFTLNALAIPLGGPLDRLFDGLPNGPSAVARLGDVPPADLRASVVDPTGGLADLDARRVRMVGEAAFDADPLRLLRGPRVAAELGFALDGATAAAIAARAALLARPARERVRDELLKVLAVDDAAAWIARLEALGLLAVVLPDVAACRGVGARGSDVLDHSLAVLDAAARLTRRANGDVAATTGHAFDRLVDNRRAELGRGWRARVGGRPWSTWWRLAALLHDVGKPATAVQDPADGRWRFRGHDAVGADVAAGVVEHLRLGLDEGRRIVAIVRHHLRVRAFPDGEPPARRSIYRYFLETGDVGVDVAMLTAAEVAAEVGRGRGDPARAAATIEALLGAWFDAPDVVVAPRLLLTGNDVMAAFAVPPGPRLGALLAGLREAQAAGEVGTADEARAWLARAAGSESDPG